LVGEAAGRDAYDATKAPAGELDHPTPRSQSLLAAGAHQLNG
jgi:hypothetical protein